MVALVIVGSFGATTTVVLKDAVDGSSRTLTDVPQGIAWTGSLFSGMSKAFSDVISASFAKPGAVTAGLEDPLGTLMKVRGAAKAQKFGDAAVIGEATPGVIISASWADYIRRCVGEKIVERREAGYADQLVRAPDLLKALRAAGDEPVGKATVGGALPATPCVDTYEKLAAYTTEELLPRFKREALAQALSMPGAEGAAVSARVQNALNAVGISTSADHYIRTALLEPVVDKVLTEGAKDSAGNAYAAAIREVLSEESPGGSLFVSVVRPALGMIEAAAFVAALPVFGLFLCGWMSFVTLGRAIATVAWIQMWLPVAALAHVYSTLSAAARIGDMTSRGIEPTSITGMRASQQILSRGFAGADLLLNAVPAFTLLTVYGIFVLAGDWQRRREKQLSGADALSPTAR